MGTKKRKTKKVKTSEETFKGKISDTANAFRNVALAVLLLLILVTPFFRGLFFPEDQVVALLAALVAAILVAVFVWLVQKNRELDVGFFSHPLDFLILALVAVYLISFLNAANPGLALNEVLENALYFVVFWCAARLLLTLKSVYIMLFTVYLASVGLSLAGLLCATEIIYIKDGYVGGRMFSSLQYANALASYLGVGLFIGFYFFCRLFEQSILEKKELFNSAVRTAALPAVIALNYIVFLVFLATGSRGGFLLLLLTLPLFILFSKKGLRLPLFVSVFITAVLSAPAAALFISSVEAKNYLYAWGWFFAGLIAVIAVHYLIYWFGFRFLKDHKKAAFIGFGSMLFLLGAVLFARIDWNTLSRFNLAAIDWKSAFYRFDFMHAAFLMIKERPLIGWGGGGWEEAYRGFQQYMFNSTQVHSYFVQVGVETGFLGLIVILGIWLTFFYTVYGLYKKGFRDIAVLLTFIVVYLSGRAAIDFDLSLSAITIVLMSCFGAAVGLWWGDVKAKKLLPLNYNHKLACVLALSLVALVFASMIALSYSDLRQSRIALGKGDLHTALELAQSANGKNPFNHEIDLYIASLKVNVGDVEGTEKELLEAVEKSPYNASVRYDLAEFYYNTERFDKAVESALKAVELAPLVMVWYERLTDIALYSALHKKKLGEHEVSREYAEIVLELPGKMKERYDMLTEEQKERWIGGRRLNNPTDKIKMRVGQAYVLVGGYGSAVEVFDGLLENAQNMPDDIKGEILYWKAFVLSELGDEERAAQLLSEAERLYPDGKKQYDVLAGNDVLAHSELRD
ncbi:O-antigen ligase family protein [Peptococcaceae bacterium]|nr:O-antigen ligase family protein [Peptococcaceae bacterium]